VPGVAFLGIPGVYFVKQRNQWTPVIAFFFVLFASIYFLYRTSTKNPGFIPEQKPPFAVGPKGAKQVKELMPDSLSSVEMPSGGHLTRFKYCRTCYIFRPPRTSHCNDCGACVERFDHHCPWVGNCIGKRNYREFMAFLCSTSLLIILSVTFSVVHIVDVEKDITEDNPDLSGWEVFVEALAESGGSMALLLYCFLAIWFVFGLLGFHLYLAFTGQTTHEKLKNAFKNATGNPYDRGNALLNIFNTLCATKVPPSRFDLRRPGANTQGTIDYAPSAYAVKQRSKRYSQKKVEDEVVSPSDIKEFKF